MYRIIKNVIETKKYDLSELIGKLETLWVKGDLTNEEKTELTTLAQNNADFKSSIKIAEKLRELDIRLCALEGEKEAQDDWTYPQYTPGKWYYSGDITVFKDKHYICTAPSGTVCTWSPEEYPDHWDELTK